MPELESLNALVVGVSADKSHAQQAFIDRFSLTFPMVPDTEKRVIDAYGAREVLGIVARRKTFVIDPAGRIAAIWPSVKVAGHVEEVVDTIRRLSVTSAGGA